MRILKWTTIGTVALLIILEAILFSRAGFFDPGFAQGFDQGKTDWVYASAIEEPAAPEEPFTPQEPAPLPEMPDGEEPGAPEDPEAEPPQSPGTPTEPPIEQPTAPVKHVLTIEEATAQGMLLLVNKQNPIASNYKPNDLSPVKYYAENRTAASRYLRKEAADQFHRLVEAAKDEGCTLVMTTAYRSYGFQQILWNNYVAAEGAEAAARYSAKPGESEHQTGLAVDVTSPSVEYQLTGSFGETPEGVWLAENAPRFGFIIRYPQGKEHITGYLYEPWHLRYVGEAVATEISSNGLTLEEYLERKQ